MIITARYTISINCKKLQVPPAPVPCGVGFPTTAYHIAESSGFKRKLNDIAVQECNLIRGGAFVYKTSLLGSWFLRRRSL